MAPRDIVLNNETGKKTPELGKRKRINAIRTEIIFISSAFSEHINMYLIFSCKQQRRTRVQAKKTKYSKSVRRLHQLKTDPGNGKKMELKFKTNDLANQKG